MSMWIIDTLTIALTVTAVVLVLRRAGTAARAAAGRRESLVEILNTVDRLTQEWNTSARIDTILRLAEDPEEAA